MQYFEWNCKKGLQIIHLSKNKDIVIQKKDDVKKWVKKYHDISSVSDSLYKFYKEKLWIK